MFEDADDELEDDFKPNVENVPYEYRYDKN